MDHDYLACPACGVGVTARKLFEECSDGDNSICPECGVSSPDEDWTEYDMTDFDDL
jgi:rubredoxin